MLALATIAVVLAGVAFYLYRSRETAKEVVELTVRGGEFQLREVMRPVKEGARALIFAFDGIGADQFYGTIDSGKTPHLQALLGDRKPDGVYEHGYAVPEALTILPSTTMAAWSSIYTGESPAQTGVPGNEWFVREEMKFYAPAPVSVTGNSHALKMLTDGLVGKAIQVPTLYEILDVRAFVSLAAVYRGADLFTTPEPVNLADLFAAVGKGLTGEDSISQEVYQQVDEEAIDTVLEEFDKHGIPNLQVVYFPGVDLYSHVDDQPLDMQVKYLQEVLDPAIARVLEAYDKAGLLDDTYVVFVSDHGHTPVLNDDLHSLGTVGEDEPPALLARLGFRLRPFVLEPEDEGQDYQATVAYQGAMAYIYLADRSTCPQPGQRCDWQRAPRLEEDVLEVARAFHHVNETGEPIPQLAGTLDLIFAREPKPANEAAGPFKVFDGEKLVPVAEYLQKNPRKDLLRLEERLQGLGAGPFGHRAGDILLLARSGIERPIEERFYFSNLYRSWHGSPTSQDSRIPLLVARKNDSGERIQKLVRKVVGSNPSQLHFVPLMKSLMN